MIDLFLQFKHVVYSIMLNFLPVLHILHDIFSLIHLLTQPKIHRTHVVLSRVSVQVTFHVWEIAAVDLTLRMNIKDVFDVEVLVEHFLACVIFHISCQFFLVLVDEILDDFNIFLDEKNIFVLRNYL